MRLLLVIAGILLAAAGGAWHLRARSLAACRQGAEVNRLASRPLPWIRAAQADPFLRVLLHHGATFEALRQLKIEAALVAGEARSWHLSEEFRAGLKKLISPEISDPGFLSALEQFSRLPAPARCEAKKSGLEEKILAGEENWRARLTEAKMARATFGRDREIYCQSEALITRLKNMVATIETRCAKSKKPCAASLTAPLLSEIEDIEAQKQFNQQKLERKWPAEVMEILKCS